MSHGAARTRCCAMSCLRLRARSLAISSSAALAYTRCYAITRCDAMLHPYAMLCYEPPWRAPPSPRAGLPMCVCTCVLVCITIRPPALPSAAWIPATRSRHTHPMPCTPTPTGPRDTRAHRKASKHPEPGMRRGSGHVTGRGGAASHRCILGGATGSDHVTGRAARFAPSRTRRAAPPHPRARPPAARRGRGVCKIM